MSLIWIRFLPCLLLAGLIHNSAFAEQNSKYQLGPCPQGQMRLNVSTPCVSISQVRAQKINDANANSTNAATSLLNAFGRDDNGNFHNGATGGGTAPGTMPRYNNYDSSSGCGEVIVDCNTHRISFSNIAIQPTDAIVDCGRPPTTKNGIGTVGGPVSGNVVKDGVDMNLYGMGTPAGGKWFHTPWWKAGQMPTGSNSSRGCIHVSPNVLSLLKKCQGSTLEIVNAIGGGANQAPLGGFRPSSAFPATK
jgi:hypothetical protein